MRGGSLSQRAIRNLSLYRRSAERKPSSSRKNAMTLRRVGFDCAAETLAYRSASDRIQRQSSPKVRRSRAVIASTVGAPERIDRAKAE
jgi:hypothetical protein